MSDERPPRYTGQREAAPGAGSSVGGADPSLGKTDAQLPAATGGLAGGLGVFPPQHSDLTALQDSR